METRNALRAAFISPESNDNFTRTIRALPESISSEGMLNCSFSTHPCYAHRKYIPCLYMLSCMLHDAINGVIEHVWRSRVDTGRDQASLWRVINDGLSRGGDGAPVADPGLSAEAFADYFDRKVADRRPMGRHRL